MKIINAALILSSLLIGCGTPQSPNHPLENSTEFRTRVPYGEIRVIDLSDHSYAFKEMRGGYYLGGFKPTIGEAFVNKIKTAFISSGEDIIEVSVIQAEAYYRTDAADVVWVVGMFNSERTRIGGCSVDLNIKTKAGSLRKNFVNEMGASLGDLAAARKFISICHDALLEKISLEISKK